jgi:cysteine synthase A
MCRRLAKEEGVFRGASTGINFAGAIEFANEMKPVQRVVTLDCDSGLKYLGGHIYDSFIDSSIRGVD